MTSRLAFHPVKADVSLPKNQSAISPLVLPAPSLLMLSAAVQSKKM